MKNISGKQHIMTVDEFKTFQSVKRETVVDESLLDRLSGLWKMLGSDELWNTAFKKAKVAIDVNKLPTKVKTNFDTAFRDAIRVVQKRVKEKDNSLKGYFWVKSKNGNALENIVTALANYATNYLALVIKQASNEKITDINNFINPEASKSTKIGAEKSPQLLKINDEQESKKLGNIRSEISSLLKDNTDLKSWADVLLGAIEIISHDVVTSNDKLVDPKIKNDYDTIIKTKQRLYDAQYKNATLETKKKIKETEESNKEIAAKLGAGEPSITVGDLLKLSGETADKMITSTLFSNLAKNKNNDNGSNIDKAITVTTQSYKDLIKTEKKDVAVNAIGILSVVHAVGFSLAGDTTSGWVYKDEKYVIGILDSAISETKEQDADMNYILNTITVIQFIIDTAEKDSGIGKDASQRLVNNPIVKKLKEISKNPDIVTPRK